MDLNNNIVLNLYSIIILSIIYFHSEKNDNKLTLQHKLYIRLLQMTILLLVIDIFSRFDGKPETIYATINYLGNLIIFLLNPILPSLWLLYVHFQVYKDEHRTVRLTFMLSFITIVNAIFVFLNLFQGWFYYIDNYNVYHRGSLFFISALPSIVLIFYAFSLIIRNRSLLDKKHFYSLIFFAIPPLVSIILQLSIYGISIMLNSVVLSVLVLLLNIQNQDMHTDHLTGVFNRKKLEFFLKKKIELCKPNETFSAIMLDINDFKKINDTFGHEVGDKALISAATILKSCITTSDFLARFGGDEFIIILSISNRADLESYVKKIRKCIDESNKPKPFEYQLSFSMGYDVYDYNTHMTVEEFQKHIDVLMYEEKKRQDKSN